MDAIQLLKADHQTVRELLEQLVNTTARAVKKRADLLLRIKMELEVHTTIEEEIFYPAFREAGEKADDEAMYFEALEEHRAADSLVMPDLMKTPPESETFSGRAKVLKDLVTHHADEEEKEMFPRARKLMTPADLKELGARMEERKKELMARAKAA